MTLRETLLKEAFDAGIDTALAFFATEAVRYYEDETYPTVVALKGAIAGDEEALALLRGMMEEEEGDLIDTAMEEEEDDHYGHDAWSEAKILMDEEEEYGDEDSVLELENSFDREEEFQSLEEEEE